jgi:sulfide dehydrogenase cytochrome subunit
MTQAADKAAPKTMTGASAEALSYTCMGCHGADGVSTGPGIPTIAGIPESNFVDVMNAYKSGEAYSTIMGRIATGYSDEEIEAMAKYFSKQKFKPAMQTVDAASAKKGAELHDKYCEKCHSEGGSVADDEASILAGQWQPYLQWTLNDVLAGKRKIDKKMKKQLKRLHEEAGDAGVTAVTNYYASQK